MVAVPQSDVEKTINTLNLTANSIFHHHFLHSLSSSEETLSLFNRSLFLRKPELFITNYTTQPFTTLENIHNKQAPAKHTWISEIRRKHANMK